MSDTPPSTSSPLFSGLKLTIQSDTAKYDVYILEFHPTKHYIIDICPYTNGTPLFQLIGSSHETQISYGIRSEQAAYNALCSLLATLSIPLPSTLPIQHTPIRILVKDPYLLTKPLLFRTPHSTHRAIIRNTGYNFFVKITGTHDESCIEMFIEKPSESSSFVAQIYSEEDCSYDGTPMKGATIDMIKASLQVCSILFGATRFELRDESNIECDTKPVPRKRVKPLSLAHMTLIKYGQTWYERNFQAYLKEEHDRAAYEKGLAALQTPITLPFKDFFRQAHLQGHQAVDLEPLYSSSPTWLTFLQKVPKDKHCELLSWAPAFMDTLMKFNIRGPTWVIDLDKMEKTTVLVLTNNVSCRLKGGAGRRKSRNRRRGTRKQKPLFVFSNQFRGTVLRV